MINKIILLYYKLTGKSLPVGFLQTHSANITNIFTETMQKLIEINISIEKSASAKDELISKLTLEVQSLELMANKNSKVVEKISKLFED